MKKEHGQSILEYTIIIAVAAAALMAMQVYVQRSLQAQLKAIDKQVAPRQIE
jgi:Flp pilus assembly pilin Flp